MRFTIVSHARRANGHKLHAVGVLFVVVASGAAFGASNAACNSDANNPPSADAATPDGNITVLPDGAPNPGIDSGPQVDGSTPPAGALFPVSQQAYLKASNTAGITSFGASIAISADGSTLAIGGGGDASNATGINGDQTNNAAVQAGAVYVFVRTGTTWSQQAYVKASNTRASAFFGVSVALSADGNTLAVGSNGESSGATGINGDQTDTSAQQAGAAYIFSRTGTTWAQTTYLKSSETSAFGYFGNQVRLSADGTTLAVGATGDPSGLAGVNPLPDAGAGASGLSGAIFVFTQAAGTWSQQAFIKAAVPHVNDKFGYALAISSDGNLIGVGTPFERSAATGINGNAGDTSVPNAGAAYTFARTGTTWVQEAYIKASNNQAEGEFGSDVSLSADGTTLAVGSWFENSNAKGINGNQADTSASQAGATYVFAHGAATWSQQAYIKASNTLAHQGFGVAVSLSSDGNDLVVGAYQESSDASGVNGNQTDTSAPESGAAYAFSRVGTTWAQGAYIKASNPRASAAFGDALALSSNGSTLVVGSLQETSDATGVNGNQADTSLGAAGAAYVFQ